jgi:hypothetical protein
VELYNKWKSQLLRLSALIAILSMHQASTSFSACVLDIKEHISNNAENKIVFWDASLMLKTWLGLVSEFRLELVNVALVGFISIFLYFTSESAPAKDAKDGESFDDPWRWTTHWAYGTSSVLSSLLVSVFVFTKKVGCKTIIAKKLDSEALEPTVERNRNDFPVAVVFFTIVSISYIFMAFGMIKVNRNISMVQSLKQHMDGKTPSNKTSAGLTQTSNSKTSSPTNVDRRTKTKKATGVKGKSQ